MGMLFSTRAAPRSGRAAMGVVDEVERAFNRQNRLATGLGFILGGVIPVTTYLVAHRGVDAARPLYEQAASYIVAGGLYFSAKTVLGWGERAFQDRSKAFGFVVLLEGTMITSQIPVLPLVLLAILVAINGIATGCALSLDRAPVRALRSPALLAKGAVAPATADGSEHLATTGAALNSISIAAPPRARRKRPSSPQARFSFDVAS
jgi:hypothetical protein